MKCHCGGKLEYHGVVRGCHEYTCQKCGNGCNIPTQDPRDLVSPCELIYNRKSILCKGCGRVIQRDQAIRTFDELGRALCIICEGREHGIIQQFEV